MIATKLEGIIEARLAAKRHEAAQLETHIARLKAERDSLTSRIADLNNTLVGAVATLRDALTKEDQPT